MILILICYPVIFINSILVILILGLTFVIYGIRSTFCRYYYGPPLMQKFRCLSYPEVYLYLQLNCIICRNKRVAKAAAILFSILVTFPINLLLALSWVLFSMLFWILVFLPCSIIYFIKVTLRLFYIMIKC